MINLDAGRFLFQQRYYLYERYPLYIRVEILYNKVFGLTIYFFITPVIRKYTEAI